VPRNAHDYCATMSDNSPGSGPHPPNDPTDGPDGPDGPAGSPADLPTEPMPVTGETPDDPIVTPMDDPIVTPTDDPIVDPSFDPGVGSGVDPGIGPTQAMPAAGEPVYGTDPTVPIATGATFGAAGGVPPGGTIPPGGIVPPGGPGDPPPPWYQRNGAVLGVLAGLLAVALLVVLLIWIFGDDDEDDELTGDTTVPSTVVTSTSVAPTTVAPTTAPATTAPTTTAPTTTAPPTTVPPTTAPPTTAPPTTSPPTTAAPTTTTTPETTPPTTEPPVVPDDATPFEILEANPDQFSTLVSLIERVGLDDDLSEPGQSFTILAPTNDAFDGVDLGGLNDQEVTDILLHHVVPESLDTGAIFAESGDLESLNAPVVVDADERTVDGASILIPDLPGSGDPDGWVHGIDAVLMP
jgi:uncharacterized surface protein with fasciclin (FAS1) repeats